VPQARHELARLAAEAGASDELLDAVRLAASEAVTNAVLHAYDGMMGEIRVDVDVTPHELSVLIADDGNPQARREDKQGLGVGLLLIAECCDDLDIVKRDSGGTEVRMRFALNGATRRT
jgi:serine/threonine-protein kinase RsbW